MPVTLAKLAAASGAHLLLGAVLLGGCTVPADDAGTVQTSRLSESAAEDSGWIEGGPQLFGERGAIRFRALNAGTFQVAFLDHDCGDSSSEVSVEEDGRRHVIVITPISPRCTSDRSMVYWVAEVPVGANESTEEILVQHRRVGCTVIDTERLEATARGTSWLGDAPCGERHGDVIGTQLPRSVVTTGDGEPR